MSEPQIQLKGVSAHYGKQAALHGIDLAVRRGECLALLGPSGCGKTTTLNLIAGFAAPSSGDIFINGRSVARVPPHKRDAAMVFQSYALFPHLTVRQNIAFGLEMRNASRDAAARRVRECLGLVKLASFGERYPKELSGGQQQRVALARALAVEPSVLLLDEPLSNLDARLREEMRGELADIQRRISVTTVFVTHDQADAMAIADRIAVMKDGRVEQVGRPAEIYEQPSTAFVATFIGRANTLPVTVNAIARERAELSLADGTTVWCERPSAASAGAPGTLLVRPEHLHVGPRPHEAMNEVTVALERLSYLGSGLELQVALAGRSLRAQAPVSQGSLEPGAPVKLWWNPRNCHLFPGADCEARP